MAWGDITNPEAWKSAMANILRRGGEAVNYIEQAPEKAGQAILEGHAKNQELWQKAHANPQRPFQVTDQNAFNELNDRYLGGVLSVAPVGMTRKEIIEDVFSKINSPMKGATQVNVPISMIEHGESATPGGRLTWSNAQDLINDYASRKTPFPPIELMGDVESKIPFMVADGSHRLEAAKLRGDTTIPAYLNKEDLDLLNKLLNK